jgi:hypothetical protein
MSAYELTNGFTPNVSHLKIFGSAVYVPIPPTKRSKMGPKRRLGIYVGFQSPSIIRYLDPATGNLFFAHTSSCIFNESQFPSLEGENESLKRNEFDFNQPETKSLHKDPYNAQGEKEVRRILYLHEIANNAPDVFTNGKSDQIHIE